MFSKLLNSLAQKQTAKTHARRHARRRTHKEFKHPSLLFTFVCLVLYVFFSGNVQRFSTSAETNLNFLNFYCIFHSMSGTRFKQPADATPSISISVSISASISLSILPIYLSIYLSLTIQVSVLSYNRSP